MITHECQTRQPQPDNMPSLRSLNFKLTILTPRLHRQRREWQHPVRTLLRAPQLTVQQHLSRGTAHIDIDRTLLINGENNDPRDNHRKADAVDAIFAVPRGPAWFPPLPDATATI